jgi:nucleotide-binding universal stress UspA family protein
MVMFALIPYRALYVALDPVGAAPTWKRIVEAAEERRAILIVLGSRRRGGLVAHLLGSVGAAVAAHSASSVLVVHGGPEPRVPGRGGRR